MLAVTFAKEGSGDEVAYRRVGLNCQTLRHQLPSAFDEASLTILRERYPDAVIVTEEDAAVLGLNSYGDGYNMVIASRAKDFERQLRERGYNPIGLVLSELLLGGGGVKCCTLELRR